MKISQNRVTLPSSFYSLLPWPQSFSSIENEISIFFPFSGAQDLNAPDERIYRTIHPSIVQTLPDDFPDLKHEFSKLESQMFDRPRKRGAEPLTPILPDAHDR